MRTLVLTALLAAACNPFELTPPAPLDGASGPDPDGLLAEYGGRLEEATGVNPGALGFVVYYTDVEGMQECGPDTTPTTLGCAFLDHGVAVVLKGQLQIVEEAVTLHELGHLMAGNPRHTETGLMRPHFDTDSWPEFRESTKLNDETLALMCGGVQCDRIVSE